MSVTPATEDGYRPIPGADHRNPVWHYKLTPGTAYWIDDMARTVEEVTVTADMAARAKSTHNLRFIGGRSAIVFEVREGEKFSQLAQPIPVQQDPVARGRKAAPEPAAPPAAPPAAKPAKSPKKQEAPRRKGHFEPL